MMCGMSTCGVLPAAPLTRARSEVGDAPEQVHLGRHSAEDADRLVHEERRVGDDEDREHELHGTREAGVSPRERERERTEDQEEQDQNPHRAVVPLRWAHWSRRQHDIHSAPRGVNAPEEDNNQ